MLLGLQKLGGIRRKELEGQATKSGRYTYYQHWAILGAGKEMRQSQGGCRGPKSNISSAVNPGKGDQQRKHLTSGESNNCILILTVEYFLTISSSGLITKRALSV